MPKPWYANVRLRLLCLITFTLSALLPAATLAVWVIHSQAEHAVQNSSKKQITLARTFALALDRYADDRRAIFQQWADAFFAGNSNLASLDLATKSGFLYVIVIEPDGSIRNTAPPGRQASIPYAVRTLLTTHARQTTAFTPAVIDSRGLPTIFIVQKGPDGQIVAGALDTGLLRSMRKAVNFGTHGHAVIVDQDGKILAHPREEWEDAMKPLSKLSPVQKVLAGETGVLPFYAPAIDEQALASFTQTRQGGWGVLMVRPLSEINALAWENTRVAIIVIGIGVAIAFASAWFIARVIVRPIENAAATARDLGDRKFSARIEPIPTMPAELGELSATLNQLAERIDGWHKTAAETLSAVRAANQAKQDFLATLSHEIRTPLNAIIGFGELATMTGGNPEQAAQNREYVQNIVAAGEHLLHLIDDILDLAAIEAGQLSLLTTSVDIVSIIQEASTLLSHTAASQKVTIKMDFPDNLPIITGDPYKIRQVVLNIMGNAIKFTPEGGEVNISAGTQGDGSLRICINDTGVGMTPDEIQTAMAPFGRVRNEKTRNAPGTGLGLPLAQRLTEIMNGQFVLQSEPNKGTHVSISLPVG